MRDNYLRPSAAKKATLKIGDFKGGADLSTDESVLGFARAADCYNFDFSDGTLKTGYGLSAYDGFAGLSLTALWLFMRFDKELNERDDMLIASDSDGWLWYKRQGGLPNRLGEIVLTDVPKFINYRLYGDDVVLICSQQDGMFVWDGASAPYKVESAPDITSLALHYERLFVTVGGEKNAVWFSDDLDPTNWDASLSGGGFIQMLDERGSLNRVISYLNYVYVFRDYGISRITAFGAQTEFSVSNLFVSSGKIYSGSVCLCGDAVIFLAEDGLYMFDGLSANKLLPNLDGLFESGEHSCSFWSAGKYYLAFERKKDGAVVGCESGSYVNNALLVLDVNKGTYALSRGVDIVGFSRADDDGVIAITSGGLTGRVVKCGMLFGTPLPKKWSIPKTDLGDGGQKTVREISVATKYPIDVVVRSDTGEKEVKFSGAVGVKKKRVSFRGRRLGFDILTHSAEADVSRPYFTVVKGGN